MSIVAHIFGTVLLVNSVPHLVQGLSGLPFHTPFADPPFVGRSSPTTNILWGGANFMTGCVLLFGVGSFTIAATSDTIAVFAIGLLAAVGIARSVQRARARLEEG